MIGTKEGYNNLLYYLKSRGLDLSGYKQPHIMRRLIPLCRRLKIESLRDLELEMRKNPYLIDDVAQAFSINVTRFFRNQDSWEALRQAILSSYIAHRLKIGQRIRIWSAGCANGCEPYSIAIMFTKMFEFDVIRRKVEILASDKNSKVLDEAKKGIYLPVHLQETDPLFISRYFTKNDDNTGHHSLIPKIKELVTFQRLDLLADPFPEKIDLLLCRNVLIYFTREAQETVFRGAYECLVGDGIFMIGRTENLPFYESEKFSFHTISDAHRLYQKSQSS
ncbi:MAG: CheR family methyltransferase [Promethearchaeota archaeon]